MRLIIQPDYQSVSQWAAHYVAAKTVCIGLSYRIFSSGHVQSFDRSE